MNIEPESRLRSNEMANSMNHPEAKYVFCFSAIFDYFHNSKITAKLMLL